MPQVATEVAVSNYARMFGWIGTTLVSLAVFIPTARIRLWTDNLDQPLLLTIMVITAAVGAFAGGAATASAVRGATATICAVRLDRRLADAVDSGVRPRGFLAKMVVPSNVDFLFAAIWAFPITLAFYERFTIG